MTPLARFWSFDQNLFYFNSTRFTTKKHHSKEWCLGLVNRMIGDKFTARRVFVHYLYWKSGQIFVRRHL